MSELMDNRRHRVEALKTMIRELHDGASPETLKARFRSVLDHVGPAEISAMETELMHEGMPETEIRRMCDLHVAVFRDKLEQRPPAEATPGHPVHTFRRENEKILEIVAAYRQLNGELALATGPLSPEQVSRWQALQEALRPLDAHYKRKEYLLFPFLERAGITAPPKVMWSVDDQIREHARAASDAAASAAELGPAELGPITEVVLTPFLEAVEGMVEKEERVLLPMTTENLTEEEWRQVHAQWLELGPITEVVLTPFLEAVEGMVEKEERVLLPMTTENLTEEEWRQVHAQWLELGPGFVAPEQGWEPSRTVAAEPAEVELASGGVRLPSGVLSAAQLAAMLNSLPVDITFVDADDRVTYFSEGPDRVFARNRAIVGRRVQDCHPPSSIHIVQKILDEMRAGSRDVAEFWIPFGGRFVHIRYFAVRDESRAYLGCLEMTQDVTAIRALQGERRLLAEGGAS